MRPGRIVVTLVLGLALAPALPAAGAGQALPVPFVAQGELLCGGASAAMVLRYHGLRDVHAEDFAPLVRPEEGGIRTGDLARAVNERLTPSGEGWRAEEGRGNLTVLAAALAAGQPSIVLLGEGAGRYHYVTVVGLEADHVLLHDPWVGPERRVAVADFERRWEAAGRWQLVLKPPAGNAEEAGRPTAGIEGAAEEDRVEVRGAAEGPDSLLAAASERFRAEDWGEAARLAERAAHRSGADPRAWRLLAVSRYLAGDQQGALTAWERAGGVSLDLVQVEGLTRTRHPVVHDLAGLEPGGTFTSEALLKARRRLEMLPSAAATGLSWRPADGERVEVDLTVVERPLLPTSRLALLSIAARAAARREVVLVLSSPWGTGSALTVEGRWTTAADRLGFNLAAPGVLGPTGITTLSLVRTRERYAGPLREELTRAALRYDEWLTGRLAGWIELAADEWGDAGTGPSAGVGVRWRAASDALELSTEARIAGPGEEPTFTTGALDAVWQSSTRPEGWTASARAGVAAASSAAPRLMWPGAGTGDVRSHRLRAHPLVQGDVVDGPALGRTLLTAGGEVVRWSARMVPARVGGAVFLDAAWAGRRQVEGSEAHIDAGLGLRLTIPGAQGVLGLDGAVGLRDGATALSLSWRSSRAP